MINIIALKCPECGANLEIENNRKQCYCQYCGAKIIVDNGSITYTYRKVDEARIREAEVNELIRMKELELEEKQQAENEKSKKRKVEATVLLGIIGSLLLMIGLFGGAATGNDDSPVYFIAFIGLFCLLAIAFIWSNGDSDIKKK